MYKKIPEFLQNVQPLNNLNIDKTFPAEAYSCFQVCVFMMTKPLVKSHDDQVISLK